MGLPVNHAHASSPALGEGTEQVSDQVTPQLEDLLAALHGEMSRGGLIIELGLSGLFTSLENGKTV